MIDEPTNHLDVETKKNLANYLKSKKGFIIVSHDRSFLDQVVDHILCIQHTHIEIQKGNFSSWQENNDKQIHFELTQNEKLQKDIQRLEIASKNTSNWSDQVEKTKYGTRNSGSKVDKGYIGHQSAKMMKRSKVIEKRVEKAIEQKTSLLKNVDKSDLLTIKPLNNSRNLLIAANDLQIKYNHQAIFDKISFELKDGERLAITGKNGAGKSSILKLILGEQIDYDGYFKIVNDLKLSYVSQMTHSLSGTLRDFAKLEHVDEGIFKAMLVKMGFSQIDLEKCIEELSEGQKKKVLLAKSISESANIYIWDEPLNYIDILTRMQIEEAILKYKPTLIFIEHDETFIKKIATKVLPL